jgi:hypothetical protein
MGTSHHMENEEENENAGEEDEGSQTDFNSSTIKLGVSSKQDIE